MLDFVSTGIKNGIRRSNKGEEGEVACFGLLKMSKTSA
jgi:hypothetical protein